MDVIDKLLDSKPIPQLPRLMPMTQEYFDIKFLDRTLLTQDQAELLMTHLRSVGSICSDNVELTFLHDERNIIHSILRKLENVRMTEPVLFKYYKPNDSDNKINSVITLKGAKIVDVEASGHDMSKSTSLIKEGESDWKYSWIKCLLEFESMDFDPPAA